MSQKLRREGQTLHVISDQQLLKKIQDSDPCPPNPENGKVLAGHDMERLR